MKKTFYTPQGAIERELTDAEILHFAEMGDKEAKQDILKKDKQQAGSLQARIEAIEKYLGV